ncbi:MAG: transglycosylase SLT domain-containing protein [Candidatus Schekmanbacteria bacterium]|nr:transglycosylase SLT domain-containing protein [Candidatus Schekmanbacteria bacterium]
MKVSLRRIIAGVAVFGALFFQVSSLFRIEIAQHATLAALSAKLAELRRAERELAAQAAYLARLDADLGEFRDILELVRSFRTGLARHEERALARVIQDEAHSLSLPPAMLMAVIAIESAFQASARSEDGAVGLMQIQPATAERLATERGMLWAGEQTLLDPIQNVRIGTYYLSKLIVQFEDIAVALEAFCKGPRAVAEQLEKGARTRGRYSSKVLERMRDFEPAFASTAGFRLRGV